MDTNRLTYLFCCALVLALVCFGGASLFDGGAKSHHTVLATAQAAEGSVQKLASTYTSATLSTGDFSSWISTATTVTLVAPEWATGTTVRIDRGEEQPYTGPIALTTQGKHTLYFQSSGGSQTEPLQTAEVWIDSQAPTMPGSVRFRDPISTGFGYAFGPSRDAVSDVIGYDIVVRNPVTTAVVATDTLVGTSGLFSQLASGTYDLEIIARDGAGNVSLPRKTTAMVGLARPQLSLSTDDTATREIIAARGWVTKGVGIAMTAELSSQAPSMTVTLRNQMGTVTTTDVAQADYGKLALMISSEGAGTIELAATDCYGNKARAIDLPLKVDRTPPPMPTTIVSQASSLDTNNTRDVLFKWSDSIDAVSGLGHYTLTLTRADGTFPQSASIETSSSQYTINNIAAGTYDVVLTATDVAGLTSTPLRARLTVAAQEESSDGSGSGDAAKSDTTSVRKETTVKNITNTTNVVNDSGSSDNEGSSSSQQNAASSSDATPSALAATALSDGTGGSGSAADGGSELLGDMQKSAPQSQTKERSFFQKLGDTWRVWVPLVLGAVLLLGGAIVLIVKLVSNRRRIHLDTVPAD